MDDVLNVRSSYRTDDCRSELTSLLLSRIAFANHRHPDSCAISFYPIKWRTSGKRGDQRTSWTMTCAAAHTLSPIGRLVRSLNAIACRPSFAPTGRCWVSAFLPPWGRWLSIIQLPPVPENSRDRFPSRDDSLFCSKLP